MHRQFTFYRRPRPKGKPVFYVRFRDGEGARLPAVSTGCTSRLAAESWAIEYMRKAKPRGKGTLAAFVERMFDDGSDWTRKRKARRGLTAHSLRAHVGRMENHVLPVLGDKPLAAITKSDLETVLADLPLSGGSRDNVLLTLRIVFREAEDRGLVAASPAARIEPYGRRDSRKRAVFTAEEMRRLFPHDKAALVGVWQDLETAAAMMTLASTGMRSGEVRALLWRHLLSGALLIERGIKAGTSTAGPTKTGAVRVALLPRRTEALILEWRTACPWTEPEDCLFAGTERGKPLYTHFLLEHLRSAMEAAGIPRAGRSPHSFRAQFNTALRGAVPPEVLRGIIGHTSESMTRLYDRPDTETLLARVQAARPVLDALWK